MSKTRAPNADALVAAIERNLLKGREVFLLPPGSKIPKMNSHGFHDATGDLRLLTELARAEPQSNLAVRTGSVSGLLVLDFDRRSGVDGFETKKRLEHELGPLPKTRELQRAERHKIAAIAVDRAEQLADLLWVCDRRSIHRLWSRERATQVRAWVSRRVSAGDRITKDLAAPLEQSLSCLKLLPAFQTHEHREKLWRLDLAHSLSTEPREGVRLKRPFRFFECRSRHVRLLGEPFASHNLKRASPCCQAGKLCAASLRRRIKALLDKGPGFDRAIPRLSQ
jgi:hypothetical protein